jgi:hypothetical protein
MKYANKRMQADSTGAAEVSHRDRTSGSYRGDRMCPVPGCGTRLSRYAPGILCARHTATIS